jgi:hypothetical protein
VDNTDEEDEQDGLWRLAGDRGELLIEVDAAAAQQFATLPEKPGRVVDLLKTCSVLCE